MSIEYTLAQVEEIDRKYSNEFAKTRGWNYHYLEEPIDDLCEFFLALTGRKILDSGCGWGRYVYRFLEQGLEYHGIDHSAEMLAVAMVDNPGVRFTEVSFISLPFLDEHFDGIWSCCSLGEIPKAHVVNVLQEHYRVLIQGGVMSIVIPFLGISNEEMYTKENGDPSIYQSHYLLDEFLWYVEKAGFEILKSGYRLQSGSLYVVAKRP